MASTSAGDGASDVLGFKPTALIDEVFNIVRFSIQQSTDALEEALRQHPELGQQPKVVREGVIHWEDSMLRVADQNLDKFELYTLKNVFAVPEDLQLASPQPMVTEEESQLDAETEALWAQLQRSLATKRELQRKLTAAQRTTELWAAHRESVHKLAASQQASNVQGTLQGLQRLSDTLQDGWHLLRSSDGVGGDSGSLVPGPRGAAQRYAQRRGQISTAEPSDLLKLSSMLAAS